MSEKEKVIIVSPHFDDAILSCGGRMCSEEWRNSEISIVNVFSEIFVEKEMLSDVIIKYVAEDMAIPEYKVNLKICAKWIEERKKEESSATHVLGVNSFNLGYMDAIFRISDDKFVYDTEKKLFLGQVRENILLEQLINQFTDICKDYSRCYFPAGIGNHPDHILLHWVGKKIQCNHSRISFYCEIPYGMDKKVVEGNKYEINVEDSYKRKVRAVSEYKTQLNWLLRNEDNIEAVIPRYEIYY